MIIFSRLSRNDGTRIFHLIESILYTGVFNYGFEFQSTGLRLRQG